MNQPNATQPAFDPQALTAPAVNASAADPTVLNLRDIHLPEPISWWPVAPGWWLLLAGLLLLVAGVLIARSIARKNYLKKQLKRDIREELNHIKKQFQQSKNKAQLAKALSILLRRASISYYPKTDVAGLTGRSWLKYLDDTNGATANKTFQSDTGEILLTAPYLSADTELNYDAQALIQLCESWLLAQQDNKTATGKPSNNIDASVAVTGGRH
jgi:hypothetical protein